MLTQEQDVELQLLREALHRKEEEVDDMRAQLAFANARMHHHEVFFFLAQASTMRRALHQPFLVFLRAKAKAAKGAAPVVLSLEAWDAKGVAPVVPILL